MAGERLVIEVMCEDPTPLSGWGWAADVNDYQEADLEEKAVAREARQLGRHERGGADVPG